MYSTRPSTVSFGLLVFLFGFPAFCLAQTIVQETPGAAHSNFANDTEVIPGTNPAMRLQAAEFHDGRGSISVRSIATGQIIGGKELKGPQASSFGAAIELTDSGEVIVSAPELGPSGAIFIINNFNSISPTLNLNVTPGVCPSGAQVCRFDYPHPTALSSHYMGREVSYFKSGGVDYVAASSYNGALANREAVIIFRKAASGWEHFYSLTVSTSNIQFSNAIRATDEGGSASSLDLIVSAPRKAGGDGEVYIFHDVGDHNPANCPLVGSGKLCTVTPSKTISSPEPGAGIEFGESLDTKPGLLLVGAPKTDSFLNAQTTLPNTGAAYLYPLPYNSSNPQGERLGHLPANSGGGESVALLEVAPGVIDAFIGGTGNQLGILQAFRVVTPNPMMHGVLTFWENNLFKPRRGETAPTLLPDVTGDSIPDIQFSRQTPVPPSAGLPDGNYSLIAESVPPVSSGVLSQASMIPGFSPGCILTAHQGQNMLVPTIEPVTQIPPPPEVPFDSPRISKPFSVAFEAKPANGGPSSYLKDLFNAGHQLHVYFWAGSVEDQVIPQLQNCVFTNDRRYGPWMVAVQASDFDANGVLRVTQELNPAIPQFLNNVAHGIAAAIWYREAGTNNVIWVAVAEGALATVGEI